MSHNAPYHHFGDRAALLGALGVRGMAALLAAQEEAVAAADGTVEKVRALGLAYVSTPPPTRRRSRWSSTPTTAPPARRARRWRR